MIKDNFCFHCHCCEKLQLYLIYWISRDFSNDLSSNWLPEVTSKRPVTISRRLTDIAILMYQYLVNPLTKIILSRKRAISLPVSVSWWRPVASHTQPLLARWLEKVEATKNYYLNVIPIVRFTLGSGNMFSTWSHTQLLPPLIPLNNTGPSGPCRSLQW